MLSLETLGALRLTGADGELLTGRRKELALLAYLARRAPRDVARVELATLLWGERDEARARHSLRQALLQLKRVLGESLVVESERVALSEPVLLDVAELERAVAEERYADAAALWRGEFMAGAEDAGGESYRLWVEGERVALRSRVGGAFEALVARAEGRGEWDEGLAVAERWTAAFPLDERAERRRLQLLRLLGRDGEARARYAEFNARIREELGRGPAPELQRIGARLDRDGGDVASATGPVAGGALFTPDLVGRSAAFSELVAAWQGVRGGATAVVLVEGERGIGKTRLCQEFIDWVTRREESPGEEEACVLWDRGESGDTAPWSTARRLLAGLAAASGLAGASPEQLAALGQLVPGVRLLYEGLPPATGDDAETSAAVTEVLRAVASEAPVLVCLDDVTSADLSTQRLMLAVARRLRAPGGVLLLLVDPESGAASDGEVQRSVSELRVMRTTRRIRLQSIGRVELETMLASMLALDSADRAALADRLTADTEGNPGRVVESVTAMLDRGELRGDGAGGWRVVPRPGSPDAPAMAHRATGTPATVRPRATALVVAAAVLVAGGGVLYAARDRRPPPTMAPAITGARSIAVMPFSHASADTATEYFTEGVTEELVHALSSVPGLRVAARTSVRALDGKRLSAREIGRALGVDAVIEGSVRTSEGRARITVQLVNAADGYDVWSERYDREMRDVLEVQDEIARAVVEKLRPRGTAPAAATTQPPRDTPDPEAHDLFLRARYLTNRSGEPNLLKAIDYYQKAIAIDSGFARAYAGLADAQLTLLEWGHPYSETAPAARAMVARALRLDPHSSDGHTALGRLLRYDWRWGDAEREFRRALAANPSDVQTRHSLSHVLISLARLDESLAESRLAVQLDPLDPRIAMHLCYHYFHARDLDAALATCQRGLELDPNFPDSHGKLAWVYEMRGDHGRALEEIDTELRISGRRAEYRAQRALIQARLGQRDSALAVLRDIERSTPRGERPLGTMAGVHAALGDRDAAFALLEQGYAEHSSDLATLRTEPALDPLRDDPRFIRLLERVGVSATHPVPANR